MENLKDIFIKYRTDLNNLKPFDIYNCPDDYILSSIKNCEGNHMSFHSILLLT